MFIYAAIVTVIGITLNILLIYTMTKVKTKMFGVVQRIFYIMAVVNIFSMISYFGLIPVLYCFEGHILLISHNFNEIPFISNLKSLYNFFVTIKAVILNITSVTLWTALSVFAVSIVFHPTIETLDYLEQLEPLQRFHLKQNLKFAASLKDIVGDYIRIINFFVYFASLTVPIFIIFFCAQRILRNLENLKKDQTLSQSTITAHERLLRVLLIQTFLPVVSFLIPSAGLGFLLVSQVTPPELFTFSIACLFPISITLYPISIVYFVDHYRKFVFQLLFCKKS
ncbi:unnamed protein product [Auanema sp. JU1783]|nr:unnamed protein product [Auanema sp. JU1783]